MYSIHSSTSQISLTSVCRLATVCVFVLVETDHDDYIVARYSPNHTQSTFVPFQIDSDFELEVSETLIKGFS